MRSDENHDNSDPEDTQELDPMLGNWLVHYSWTRMVLILGGVHGIFFPHFGRRSQKIPHCDFLQRFDHRIVAPELQVLDLDPSIAHRAPVRAGGGKI